VVLETSGFVSAFSSAGGHAVFSMGRGKKVVAVAGNRSFYEYSALFCPDPGRAKSTCGLETACNGIVGRIDSTGIIPYSSVVGGFLFFRNVSLFKVLFSMDIHAFPDK
jgi:hypothetical protein